MWSSVENDLAAILSTRVFHTLVDDPAYLELFRKAGFGGKLPKELTLGTPKVWAEYKEFGFQGKLPTDLTQAPADIRERLGTAARLCAHLLLLDVASRNSLRERRAKVVVLEGPATLYRLWSNKDNNQIGSWWFTSSLLSHALANADNDRAKTTTWLRDCLAISLDFGDCDRVAQLTLGLSSAVPSIEAWGLPMRHYSANALQKDPSIPLTNYLSNREKFFQGEKTQYFLPFIPASRVTDYW